MATRYKIHPAIGIARLGNSPNEFYLSPEVPGGLPVACDERGNAQVDGQGNEQTTIAFKDGEGRVKRQAARFRIYVYDDQSPGGRELKLGDPIQGIGTAGKLVDITWTAYLANKKASWYTFEQLEGEHGYAKDQPRRNLAVQGDARLGLNIDPGPQWVDCTHHRHAEFAAGKNPGQTQTFPPPLAPLSIDTLGGLQTDDHGRLLVLGGHGNSGSYLTGVGEPQIVQYANNDGWFDDVSDGPVSAILKYWDDVDLAFRYVQVDDPAWVMVGYPRFAPQILDMVTLDDVLYDLSVREFALDTYLYGMPPFAPHAIDPENKDQLLRWRGAVKWYNPDYYPYFYKEIWPILQRPFQMQWVTDFLQISNDAHDPGPRGDFELTRISQPPSPKGDPYRAMRIYIYQALRKEGEENVFLNTMANPNNKIFMKEKMPLLAGDNPISNTLPSKFLRLTDTMLFLLKQWAEGKFVNEQDEAISEGQIEPVSPGVALDRGVVANILGGAFCPGGEVGWVMRNPRIYTHPYRIRQDPAYVPTAGSGHGFNPAAFLPAAPLNMDDDFAVGLGPGDVTKHMSVPWQADFNECSTQSIDVTYLEWNVLYDEQGEPTTRDSKVNETLWWPSHRPMQVYRLVGPPSVTDPTNPGNYAQGNWAVGVPQTNAGDFKMVTAWKEFGFVVANPYTSSQSVPLYIEIEGQGS